LDLHSPLGWQCALAEDSRHNLLRMAASAWGEKPYGFRLLFISQRRLLQRPNG
jgi:hypothetical protein